MWSAEKIDQAENHVSLILFVPKLIMLPNVLLTILLIILDISHCVIRASSISDCVIAFVPYNIKYTGDAQHAWQVLNI